MNILEEIIAHKKEEVAEQRRLLPLESIKSTIKPVTSRFGEILSSKSSIRIIAEIKRKSPTAGIIRDDFDPAELALLYQSGGAAAISVLTDELFFGGSPAVFKEIRKTSILPLLRKEFIIDEYQIYESCLLQADAVLLIAAILEGPVLRHFITLANQLGLSSLVEVHDPAELQKALHCGARIIGINNRDLKTFRTDLKISLKLKKLIPPGFIAVSESGIKDRSDLLELEKAGFQAALIGETLMRSENIPKTLSELLGAT
ncbi:MAG: indole-3-glycerol phosphate synthase TrpC [Candidatus Wallbacteria bacterium]|nr:indole-3-glycerol phosphate synthase TrpC [Candidatus Wallbacteria bacterium]